MKVFKCDKCGSIETETKNWCSIQSDGPLNIKNGFRYQRLIELNKYMLDLHFCSAKCLFSYFQNEKTFCIKSPEYKIVCICGSSRFKDEILRVRKTFTEKGYIVLSPEIFMHAGDAVSEECKEKLDALHFAKIQMADFIYVVDQENEDMSAGSSYMGKSTIAEFEFAVSINKHAYLHSQRVLNDIDKLED
ncbi:MAG: hypothetical protein ABFD02_08145 [Bacteroidales bacterium]